MTTKAQTDHDSASLLTSAQSTQEAPARLSTPQAAEAPDDTVVDPKQNPELLGVVGLGASAGGLEALEEFFSHMPHDTGLAFVVVQHLSPDFESLMDEILSRRTTMPVHRVEHNMKLAPNAIYVIPPKKELRLSNDRLLLQNKATGTALTLPIDVFFESLANQVKQRAIAVVLSGSGSDGSRGVRAVHEQGGMVLAQEPDSAKFDSMPKSAVEAGVVDATGTPAELPHVLLRYLSQSGARRSTRQSSPKQDGLEGILAILRREHGLDFSSYKPTTIKRRVERRVMLNRLGDLEEYTNHLSVNLQEVQALYWDLLIGVTKFFRDAEAFQYLKTDVIPELVAKADAKEGIRAWVAGCATGEEAYSLAILFREEMEAQNRQLRFKLFATDVHRTSLELAAAGCYAKECLSELEPERIPRHFKTNGDEYQVVPELRHMVVFASHNVLRDAPFTKLNLVTCRNLLIYLKPEAQLKALSLLHFGLQNNGLLFLGPSETPGGLSTAFETLHPHWKIYRKRGDLRIGGDMKVSTPPSVRSARPQPSRTLPQESRLQRAQQSLIARHAPPSILVGPNFEVVHTFSGGGDWLSHQDGRPTLHVLDLVKHELKLTLNAALQRARKTKTSASFSSISISEGRKVGLHVEAIADPTGTCFLITIVEEESRPHDEPGPEANIPEISRKRIDDLEKELQYTKENLQATLEEMETANEELQAANEELVASNEELQSTNEELHSVNEELFTVNSEHQRKIEELTELTEDMENLFSATDVGTVFLDRALCIRRFTPRIAEMFEFLPQDIGRPITSFAHTLRIGDLVDDLHRVLSTHITVERQALDRTGKWYLARITPYQVGDVSDGVVLSLVDITALKETEARLRLMSKVFKDVADPIIIEDLNAKVVDLNPEAERAYGYARDELLGQSGLILVPEDRIELEQRLRRECLEKEYVHNGETTRRTKDGAEHPALSTFSKIAMQEGEPPVIAIISKDITLRKEAEQAAQDAVRKRDEFLAMLSHELRNPLGVIQNATQLLSVDGVSHNPESVERYYRIIHRQVKHMASLLGDLLDVSRVTQGKVELERVPLHLEDTIEEAVEAVSSAVQKRQQQLNVSLTRGATPVLGDPARLRQIQENLLTNASKYTPNGGHIGLSLSREGKWAVLRISDTGRGIPADRLESIFELFNQVDSKLDRADGGMGVGLTLVRSLVQLHGGHVTARSNGPDAGSVFEVWLPIHEPENDTKNATTTCPPSPRHSAPSHRNQDVLIIEDNQDARETLRVMLELEGYQVRVTSDGLSGLEAIDEQCPAVALVDIGLPGMSGYELARHVRDKYGDEPCLIALTGYGRPEDRERVETAGFDHHLVKPISRRSLLQAMTRETH